MKIIATEIAGLNVIEMEYQTDLRGYFVRTYCRRELEKAGIGFTVAQASESHSPRVGTLRGMHFRKQTRKEFKLVRCTGGRIYDVVADIRPQSPTYGKWLGFRLSGNKPQMLSVSPGLAHGFLTLTKNCTVEYLISELYDPDSESGFRYDDPKFAITWPIPVRIISDKDRNWNIWKK